MPKWLLHTNTEAPKGLHFQQGDGAGILSPGKESPKAGCPAGDF